MEPQHMLRTAKPMGSMIVEAFFDGEKFLKSGPRGPLGCQDTQGHRGLYQPFTGSNGSASAKFRCENHNQSTLWLCQNSY